VRRLGRTLGDRRVVGFAYAVYLLAVLYLVLWPQPDAPGGAVSGLTSLLHRLGFGGVSAEAVEIGLNVVLFVPLGALGLLLWRLPWWSWAGIGLALSAGLETIQALFLPERTPTLTDVAANAWGALMGAALAAVARRELRAARDPATSQPPALARRHLAALEVLFVVGVVVLVWSPTSAVPTQVVSEVSVQVAEAGAPGWLSSTSLWERLLNVLLFVPLGMLAGLARPGWSLVRWAAIGLLASLAVELVQAWLLPARDAEVSDLVMNTAGMVAGAWLTRSIVLHLRALRRRPAQ
jgi:glycopeptide antibiotics resistance protein